MVGFSIVRDGKTMASVTCPDRRRLENYLLGKLSEQDLDSIAGHVDTCTICQSAVEALDHAEDSLVAELHGSIANQSVPDEELEELVSRALIICRGAPPAANSGRPAQLGQYQLLETLGQGGMGTVYKAFHPKLKRTVALKVLAANRVNDPTAIARFQREMEAVGGLDHPNIVRAHDAGEADGQHFLVMEFVEGVNLSRLVRCAGPLSVPDACEIIRQAAIGLHYAHQHGLVHRDVKPSNLMLTSQGTVKVLDLGLARLRSESTDDSEFTSAGQIMGSPDFMAPEQGLDSRDADARTDVYSLGCTLYFLLTARPPYVGRRCDTAAKKLLAHVQEPVTPIQELRPETPDALAHVLDRMLAKDPHVRYSSAIELTAALVPLVVGTDLGRLWTQRADPCNMDALVPQEQLAARRKSCGNARRKWLVTGTLSLLAVMCIGLWFAPGALQTFRGHNAVLAVEDDPSGTVAPSAADKEGQDLIGAAPNQGRNTETEDSRAAAAYLTRADISDSMRNAMLTVLRQHPTETRWSGRSGPTLFALTVKRLPSDKGQQRATAAMLDLTHMLAVHELLKAKSLLERYEATGLTDATTLRQAIVEASGSLQVTGKTRGIVQQASVQDGYAVAYVLGEEAALTAHLLAPMELAKVRVAYRDVMHRQARDLMKRSNWKDALLLWQHLHKRKLVSQQLYLDAARCFKELEQPQDVVRVLNEAVDTFGKSATPEFLEQAGDMALAIDTEAAQSLAERAYHLASEQLRETVSSGQVLPGDTGQPK
jgi:tRNA A-37 threonylcarbamoyl transferase component Bud32